MRRTLTAAVLLLTAAAFLGCSSAPESEERAATQAMAGAEAAKAAVYAPVAWKAAEDTLQAARTEKAKQEGRFALFRNYGDTKALYERAATLADQARISAQQQQDVVRQEAETLLTQAQTALDGLSERLKKIRPRKDNKAEIEMMKRDVAALQQGLDEARTSLSQGDFDGARTKAQSVLDKTTALRGTIKG
jgi:hypothetical protein